MDLEWATLLRAGQFRFSLLQKFIRLDNFPGNRRSSHDVRRGEVEFAWSTPPGEVAVLRADSHGFRVRRSPRARIDAGTAGRIDQLGAGLFEDLYITSTTSILFDLLRPELNVEPHAFRNPLTLRQRALEHLGIHVHIGHLASCARTTVGRINPDFFRELVDGDTVPWIAWCCHHRSNLIEIDLKTRGIVSVTVAEGKTLAHFISSERARAHDVVKRDV